MKEILLLLLVVAIAGCPAQIPNLPMPIAANQSSVCHNNNGLPDSTCTPGAINPNVNQSDIQSTICVTDWTATIRPATSYTNRLKVQSIKDYGYNDTNMSDYEEDHLISLELGGNPTDVKNLWAEPYYGQYNAKDKDKLENFLRKQVCDGTMTLAEVQMEISTNWIQFYRQWGLGA